MRELLRRLWRFVRHDKHAADLEEEMRLHLDLRASKLREQGFTAPEATAEAKRRFGNPTLLGEQGHDVWGFGALEQLRQDVRFALRRVKQNPRFSLPIVVVLALGIGPTTAVFSAVDAALLRPLPFQNPHELLTLTEVSIPFGEEVDEEEPIVTIQQVRQMSHLFSSVAAFASGGLNLADPTNPQRVQAGVVTGNFFTTLGVLPRLGRTFSEDESVPSGLPVVMLSHALWQRQFGGNDVLGKPVTLHGKPYTIIGIMPAGFSFPSESDLWIPMSVPTTRETFAAFRGYIPSRVVARVAPGLTPSIVSSALLAVWDRRLAADTAKRFPYFGEYVAAVRSEGAAIPLQRRLVGDRTRALGILMGATGLLLLIVCANVANLMLIDAARRQREVALRRVLGASGHRIVRQLLAESVTLSLAGAVLGIALAPAALRLLRFVLPPDLAGVSPAQVDLRVLLFATTVALGTGIAFGLWPALSAARRDAADTMKSGGYAATLGTLGRARRLLVTAELALTVMLLVAAGLMIRSFDHLMSEDVGMQPERVATVELSFPRLTMKRADRLQTIERVRTMLANEPGIEAVGVVNDLPLRGGGGMGLTIKVDGAPEPKEHSELSFVRWLMADAGYFNAMRIGLLRGRLFTVADDSLAPKVAVISRSMAQKFWPGADPIGRTFHYPGDSQPVTVIGVVRDVRERRLDQDPAPQMYFSMAANTPDHVAIVARSSLAPAVVLDRLRGVVRRVDATQAVYNARMMEDVIRTSVAPRRTNTVLIAIFAGLALALAALGVYAVVSYGVTQRSREFGIRSALGASGRDLLGLVAREMVGIAVLGVAIGLAGAWTFSRMMTTLMYGVDVHDPATFVLVPLVLLVPAALATLLPASRATRVNPAAVMRVE
jgi:putative ABC transport system permease protein